MTEPSDPWSGTNWSDSPSAPQPGDAPEQPPLGTTPDQPQPAAAPPVSPPSGPGWQAPPPSGPGSGWGPTPPPAPTAGQPGWGQPPGGYGGYGTYPGQWAWNGSSWVWVAAPPAPPRSFLARHRVALVLGAFALVVVLVIGGCVALLLPSAMAVVNIERNSGGRIVNVQISSGTDGQAIHVYTAAGVGASEGQDLACNVVRPAIKGTALESYQFEIIDTTGRVIATQDTSCP